MDKYVWLNRLEEARLAFIRLSNKRITDLISESEVDRAYDEYMKTREKLNELGIGSADRETMGRLQE